MIIWNVKAVILVFTISLLMLFACKKTETPGAAAPPPSPEQAHRMEMLKKSFADSKKVIAIKVNGEPITEFSLLREMNTIAPQYLAPGQKPTPEVSAKIRKDALNTLVIQELAVQEARKRGMKASPETIDNEIRKMKGSMGSEDAFKAYLSNNGLTENDLRMMIEQDYIFELIAAHEIDAKITVKDAALRELYNREKKGLVTNDASHRQLSFEEAKGLLEQKLRAEAGEKRMREWEKELRKNARVEIVEKK
jgi:SurA-like protein